MIWHNVTVSVSLSVSSLVSPEDPAIPASAPPNYLKTALRFMEIEKDLQKLFSSFSFWFSILEILTLNWATGSHGGLKLHRFLFLALPVFDSVGVDKMQSWWFMLATQDTNFNDLNMCSLATSLWNLHITTTDQLSWLLLGQPPSI